MSPRSTIIRKTLASGALIVGVGVGAAGIASAATSSGSSSSTSSSGSTSASGPLAPPSGAPGGPAGLNPATVSHGPGETLLTGTSQQKADAAATAAVPGATIIRAETDSSGAATYEVHMKKSDGTYVTVQLNSDYQAVKTISGFGPGPAGSPGGPGAPSGTASSSAAA